MKKLLIALLFVSCTHQPKSQNLDSKEIQEVRPMPPAIQTQTAKSGVNIDLNTLERTLNLDRRSEVLGYKEKQFNTCQVGAGFPTDTACESRFLISINFRLMCRDSEGTTSQILTDADLKPLAGESIQWFLKNVQGETFMESGGYGKILALSKISQKNERLRISNQKDFALMRAHEMNRLILPRNWCQW